MLMPELLDHSLELGISSLDLILSQVCTLLEIISDITHRHLPLRFLSTTLRSGCSSALGAFSVRRDILATEAQRYRRPQFLCDGGAAWITRLQELSRRRINEGASLYGLACGRQRGRLVPRSTAPPWANAMPSIMLALAREWGRLT